MIKSRCTRFSLNHLAGDKGPRISPAHVAQLAHIPLLFMPKIISFFLIHIFILYMFIVQTISTNYNLLKSPINEAVIRFEFRYNSF